MKDLRSDLSDTLKNLGESSFQISPDVLEALKAEGLPDKVLKKLSALSEDVFTNEGKFLSAIRKKIGKKSAAKYALLIVEYADNR